MPLFMSASASGRRCGFAGVARVGGFGETDWATSGSRAAGAAFARKDASAGGAGCSRSGLDFDNARWRERHVSRLWPDVTSSELVSRRRLIEGSGRRRFRPYSASSMPPAIGFVPASASSTAADAIRRHCGRCDRRLLCDLRSADRMP